MNNLKTRNLIFTAMFVALIAVGAFLKIPIPALPISLQNLFTMLGGLILGGPLGAAAVLCYIFLGLAGLPIFTAGGGLGYVFQPSFGYIIGFAVGAYVTGVIAHGSSTPSYKRLLAANFAGLIPIYGIGMTYYALISDLYLGKPMGLWPLFLYCFLMTIPGDIIKCVFSAVLYKRILPYLKRIGLHK